MFLCVLLVTWIAHASALNVSISQKFGVDDTSCFNPNGTLSCQSISYALGILNDATFDNETIFVFSIRDKHYDLQTQVQISQPRMDRHILITSADKSTTTVIRCGFEFSGVIVGSENGDTITTNNIHISNIEFQQFTASSAAVVMMWNSDNVSFKNCVFRDNKRAGITAHDSGVTIEGCIFSNNSANVQRTRFSPGQSSVAGGAGFVFRNANHLNLVIRNTNFTGNSAAVNDSENFIPPAHSASMVPELNFLGGGLLVAFLIKAKSNKVLVANAVFENNRATFGGGLFHFSCQSAEGNSMEVQGSSFIGNRASQAGGGLSTSLWDFSEGTLAVKDSVIRDNWSRRGGGLNVFFMNYYSLTVNQSLIQFNNVTLDGNAGRASAAVRLDTSLPVGFTITVVPEFIDCTIMNHGATYLTYTAPFTSQRVNAKFIGRNVFTENHGAGAVEYQEGVINVIGTLEFIKNSGSHGGAVLLRSSQVTLYPDSELSFVENSASGVGGAILVQTRAMYEFIHEYNPDCFVKYSEKRTKPSQWKVRSARIFSENNCRAGLRGAFPNGR